MWRGGVEESGRFTTETRPYSWTEQAHAHTLINRPPQTSLSYYSPAWCPETVNCTKFYPECCHLRTCQTAESLKVQFSTFEVAASALKQVTPCGVKGSSMHAAVSSELAFFRTCPDTRLSERSMMRLWDQWKSRTVEEKGGCMCVGGAFNTD